MKHLLRPLVALIVLVTSSSLLFGQAGQSGFAFLKLGLSGRGVAMGDAMSASAAGAAAAHYNPAGLLGTPGEKNDAELMFMHKEWIQDTRMEFLGAAVPLDNDDALGAAIATTTVSDIEVRLRPGPPDGTFTARELSAGLSYARRITPDVRVGVTAKFLYQKIYVDDASGFGFDVGGVWSSPIENLTVGAAVANVGAMTNLRQEKTALPSLLRLGPAYRFSFNEESMEILGAADVVRVFPESKNYLNTGAELTFNKVIAARIGYQFGSEGRGLSAGVGLRYGRFTLDYAFAKLSSDLGDGHTISLALSL